MNKLLRLAPKLKWTVVLIVSSLVLIWRVLDFVYEAIGEDFHMTRGGFSLSGPVAEIVEMLFIIFILVLMLKSTVILYQNQKQL